MLIEEVRPPRLPRKLLAAGKSDPRAAFKPKPQLDTPEKLQAELSRQWRRYAPILRNLAPALPSMRDTLRLEDFQWRLETDADRADVLHAMSGAGEWTTIKVPYFGGPIGRAVAYYRTTFSVTRAMLGKGAVFVRFGAVDYKAHVFVNGQYLGSHEGFFAPFEFECAASLREGENIGGCRSGARCGSSAARESLPPRVSISQDELAQSFPSSSIGARHAPGVRLQAASRATPDGRRLRRDLPRQRADRLRLR